MNKTLKSVTVYHDRSAVDVVWNIEVTENGAVIATAEQSYSYPEALKAQLLAEVPGAENYIAALGW